MTNVIIGIIAEDESDFDTLVKIIPKVKPDYNRFKKALGKGAGRIVSKCRPWSAMLKNKGCTHLIVLRDSDGKDKNILKKQILKALSPHLIEENIVIIAVHELESWLLSDPVAIHKAFSNTNTPLIANINFPESLKDPKKELTKLVKAKYKQIYLNTKHNKIIADKIDIEKIKKKCPSFSDLLIFLT